MIVHMFLGFVASLLGALVIPAIFKPDFTAGVFVSIGTAQFHTIRGLERESWRDLDKGEPVPRGAAYIDGMAVSFEARIFLVMAVSAITTVISYFLSWPVGLICGVLIGIAMRMWKQGKTVSDIGRVSLGQIEIRGTDVSVDGLQVDITLPTSDLFTNEMLALVVEPNNLAGVLTLAHLGQQQAILHNLAVAVGVQTHASTAPVVTYYPKQKKLIAVILPIAHDEQLALSAVAGAPVLEGVIRHKVTD